MAILDKIGQEKLRISERLAQLDAERTKLSSQLDELQIAERALQRFRGKAAGTEKRQRGRPASTASKVMEKRKPRNGQHVSSASQQVPSLRDAALKAVQAHAKGVSAGEVLD